MFWEKEEYFNSATARPKGRTPTLLAQNSCCPYLLISFTLLVDILEIEEPSPVENNSSKADNEEKFEGTSPAVDCSILMAEDRYKDN